MIPELLAGRVEVDADLVELERRQRVVALPRRLEDVAAGDLLALQIAGLARHADLILDTLVVGLELGVAQRPVDDRGIFRDCSLAVALDGVRAHPEIVVVEAPGDRTVVHGAAAGLVAIALRRDRGRARFGVRAPGDRLALDVRAQVHALKEAELVLGREVLGCKPRPAFEPDDLEACSGEFDGEDAAGCADADDGDICFLCRHGQALRTGARDCSPMISLPA